MNGTNIPGEESRDTHDPDKGRFGGLTLNFSECLDIEDDAPRLGDQEPGSEMMRHAGTCLIGP